MYSKTVIQNLIYYRYWMHTNSKDFSKFSSAVDNLAFCSKENSYTKRSKKIYRSVISKLIAQTGLRFFMGPFKIVMGLFL